MKTLLYSLAIASVIGLTASRSGGKTQQADNAPAPASAVAQQDAVELLGDWDILQVNQTPVEQTDDTPYLSFNLGEHTVAGMTGCNRLMGTIVTGDAANQISFKDVAITRMACPTMHSRHRFSLRSTTCAATPNSLCRRAKTLRLRSMGPTTRSSSCSVANRSPTRCFRLRPRKTDA